jgi:hypothetical protein
VTGYRLYHQNLIPGRDGDFSLMANSHIVMTINLHSVSKSRMQGTFLP